LLTFKQSFIGTLPTTLGLRMQAETPDVSPPIWFVANIIG